MGKPHCPSIQDGCAWPEKCDSYGVCQQSGQFLSFKKETVDHLAHYGGENNPYEVIKVLYAWGLNTNFCLGNTIKYIARHEHKNAPLEDLKKARWYLDEHIKQMEKLT